MTGDHGCRPVLCALGGLALACTTGTPTPDAPTPRDPGSRFVREVTGIEVLDSTGTPYDFPFLGGLNLPRPQWVDIDDDGDLDLFVQEYSDRLMFFEQVGTDAESRYVFRTDAYQDIRIGEWYRFADMDDDLDVDLLAERPFSYISYYRNDGTPEAAHFVLAADTVKDALDQPLFADRQNIPQVTDIDCNGRLDLFIGRITGTVARYEEVGRDIQDIPRFQLVNERFEDIEIIAQIGSRHGANTMSFVDIDRDGDQDLFWGDFFEPGLLMIENTGTCESPSLRGEPFSFPPDNPIRTSGYNASSFGDVDHDGDLDLLVGVLGGAFNPNHTSIDNLLLLEATGPRTFTQRTSRLLPGIDVGSESYPVLVDLDGDGDLDLLLGNKIEQDDPQTSRVMRYENVGSPAEPRFQRRDRMDLSGAYHLAPTFWDLDADGDLDMLVGQWRAHLGYYENTGSATAPQFTLRDSALVTLTRGSNATPTLVDIDADGDADLFVGEASGTINFYRNDGNARQANFVLVDDNYLGIDAGRRSVPAFADLDGDGDLELLIGTETDGMVVYRNDGTRTTPDFVLDSAMTLPVPPFATPIFADIDADGDVDFFSGGIGGGLLFYRNRGS